MTSSVLKWTALELINATLSSFNTTLNVGISKEPVQVSFRVTAISGAGYSPSSTSVNTTVIGKFCFYDVGRDTIFVYCNCANVWWRH